MATLTKSPLLPRPLAIPTARFSLGLCLAATLTASALQAQSIIETFDTHPGSAGNGWVGAWGTNTGQGNSGGNTGTTGTAVVSTGTSTSSPLNGGGQYLTFTGSTSETGDRNQFNSSTSRRYQSFGDVDVTQTHVITFDFRIDSLTGFDSGSDFVGAFGHTGATFSNNFGFESSWTVRVFAGQQGNASAFTWGAHNGNRAAGSYSGNNIVALKDELGNSLTAQVGVVYTVTVVNYAATGYYDVYVTDGTVTVSATGLGYRTSNWGENATATPVLAFQSQVNAIGNSATFSVDNISIGAAPIPEPASVAVLAALGALGFAGARRRRVSA